MPVAGGSAGVFEELHLISLGKHQPFGMQDRGGVGKELLLELTVDPGAGDQSRNDRLPFVPVLTELISRTGFGRHGDTAALRSVAVRSTGGSGASRPNSGITLVANNSSCSKVSPSGITA